ncbi:type II toxin-antitoxin system death-on-curing family toxin [Nesterenkonia marinintestina]|uniref:type II toxin-antitoxin system death-on-curing family toxin n=1 Tax=Nesterenkonia marinintestina TaxID=2979865 RepID=UPI0021BF301F|nr:Fic family protein [Nesterenkonia sp. GX14115]
MKVRYRISATLLIEINGHFTDLPVRDRNGLESACNAPHRGYGGCQRFPGLFQKAAALLFELATTQYFGEGNKRTAWAASQFLLADNGYYIEVEEDEEVADFVEYIAKTKPSIDEIADWLVVRRRRRIPRT